MSNELAENNSHPNLVIDDRWDKNEPRSILNLIPTAVRESLEAGVEKRPDLFGLPERQLARKLKDERAIPDSSDNRIRLAFWNEYEHACRTGQKFEIARVYGASCSKSFFYNNYITNPTRLAWMVCTPASYDVVMEEALQYGIEQLRDLLEMDITGPNGKIDVRLAELKTKIVAMLDQRVKGKVIQETRNLNLNVGTTDKDVAKAAMGQSMEAIQKRLKELEKRDRLAKPAEIEVTSE